MTVINPNSISGITSITLPAGADNVLTIHTNDGVERFRIDSTGNIKVGTAATISPDGDVFFTGVTTATTFTGAHSGSGANLTNLPAANITGTLPAISAANLTNVPAANITGTLPAIDGSNLTGIGGTDFIHAEQISVSGVTTSQAFIPSQGQLSHRNLIINGGMKVAQRNTSATAEGYTCDRYQVLFAGHDEAITQAQVDVASGTTPYSLGFRKALKLTNGNQTGGAGSSDYVLTRYKVEAQDIASSGWNYTSSSSYITLSFWIKSSVTQTFRFNIIAADGTMQNYAYDTGTLSADTWTKVTKTIPGASNIQFDNDNGVGLQLDFWAFAGTAYTSSSVTLNQWAAYSSGSRMPDHTSTWYTTNDATLELTGVQLEVGSAATPFIHRSYGDELAACQRYYYKHAYGTSRVGSSPSSSNNMGVAMMAGFEATAGYGMVFFPVVMRATPTLEYENVSNGYKVVYNNTLDYFNNIGTQQYSETCAVLQFTGGFNITADSPGWVQIYKTNSYVAFTAEL